MSDHDDDLDYTPDDDANTGGNPLRQQMRKLEKQVRELTAERDAARGAERKLAFVEAGVDLTAPGAKYFIKGYDGELTAEAIKAAAVEEGFIKADKPEDGVTAEERAQHDEIDRAASGGTPPGQARNVEEQLRALAGRHDLTPAQQKQQFDALMASTGLMPG